MGSNPSPGASSTNPLHPASAAFVSQASVNGTGQSPNISSGRTFVYGFTDDRRGFGAEGAGTRVSRDWGGVEYGDYLLLKVKEGPEPRDVEREYYALGDDETGRDTGARIGAHHDAVNEYHDFRADLEECWWDVQ